MVSLLVVTDPFGDSYSVQFEFIISLIGELKKTFSVSIFSPYLSEDKASKLKNLGIKVMQSNGKFWINGLLKVFGKRNESMMWLESWSKEAYFGRNTIQVQDIGHFDKIINISMTVPVKCDLLLLQGRSVYYPLKDVGYSNRLVRTVLLFFGKSIKKRDMKLLELLTTNSKKILTNAKYLSIFYEELGFKIDGVVFTSKSFDDFKPTGNRKKDYVLTYIGKETDFPPILEIANRGIKVIGFGSKIPVGISFAKVEQAINFLGYVSSKELVDLYSGALFTAFPFTEEPFGYVPIESMACGTPVLSYSKQGPSETIIDGKTGWLVSSDKDFVEKALEIWTKGSALNSGDCIKRALEFRPESVAHSMIELMH
jgi:glycosyltransferase involved in cell wall biosynthesis